MFDGDNNNTPNQIGNSIHDGLTIRAMLKLKLISYNSWFLVDLDNTVFESITDLGGDQWFCYLISYACKLIPNKDEALACVFAIYHEVQEHINVKAVESSIIMVIKALQHVGIPVFALTARDSVLRETTLEKLASIGINLQEKIIFCSGQNKGKCWKQFLLDNNYLPSHVFMMDDKGKHLLDVQESTESLNIKFTGYRYGFLDEKIKQFNAENASRQLAELFPKLSSSTQHIIERLQLIPQTLLTALPQELENPSKRKHEETQSEVQNNEESEEPKVENVKMKRGYCKYPSPS